MKPEPRPAMVTRQVTILDNDTEIPVIVGATSINDETRDDLEWIHRTFETDASTGLSRPTALILTWPAIVKSGEFIRTARCLSGKRAYAIIERFNTINGLNRAGQLI